MVCGPSAHTCYHGPYARQPVVPSLAPPIAKAAVLPPLYRSTVPVTVRAAKRLYFPTMPPSTAFSSGAQLSQYGPSRPSSATLFQVPPVPSPVPSILPPTVFPGPEYTSAVSFSTPSYPLGPPHPDSGRVTMLRGGGRGLPSPGRNTAFAYPSSMAWNGPVDPRIVASRPMVEPGAFEYVAPNKALPGRQAYYSRDNSFLPFPGKVRDPGLVASYMYHWNTPLPPVVPRPGEMNYGLF